MKGLEKTHKDLEGLVERLRDLAYKIFQYNPAFEGAEKTSLVVLGHEARAIGNQFEIIGVNLINEEETQRNETG